MRMRVTALLLICLAVWIHTAESGPGEEFGASTTYPEDQDGSGDDLEISGSGSGDEGTILSSVATPSNTTMAPSTNKTQAAVMPVEDFFHVEATEETTPTMAATTGTPTTTVATINMGAIDTTTTPLAPVNPAVATDEAVTTLAAVTPTVSTSVAPTTQGPVSPAVATTTASTRIPTTTGTAAPDQDQGLWELPEDPLRETTSASPVTTEAVTTPPEDREPVPVETTQSLLTVQSSTTTAVPPIGADADSEVSTRTPVAEEEDEDEEEEGPTPTEETSLFPSSTPALETELDELGSGDDSVAAPTVSPTAVESVKPNGRAIIPGNADVLSRGNNPEEPVSDDSDLTFDSTYSQNQSLLERKEVLGGVIAGGVVGLAFAILLVSLMVYRMKKKDEGSYSLDEHKHPNGGYQKARRQEEFLA